jgi:hypothetical protein
MAWGSDPLTQHQGESFDSISSPCRTGVEAILTELGPENQNWRYAASSYSKSASFQEPVQVNHPELIASPKPSQESRLNTQ